MKNKHLLLAAVLLPALLSGCGLEIFQDWQNSQGEAMPGAGAIAGKDYITGLEPSTNARDYFSTVSDDKPIETVSRNDSRESKTGVRFVNDGGIVIPPGVTISFENKGYCLDPNLPAPKAGDEYQFVPMKRLIPTELQGTYKRLIAQESAGSSDVKMNMQRLVWAMRTAGTESALANSLTSQQKQILDRCSDYAGQFESFNESAKSSNKLRKELNKLADSLITIRLGDVTYSASDLLNPEAGLQKISDHVDHLIELGDALPVENTGFNYGELEPGIYTDIQGTGYMQFHVRIANNTSKDYTFYPSDYVGQVGSPSKSSGLNLYAAECIGKQRMTCSNQNKTDVVDKKEPCKHVWAITDQKNKVYNPDIDKLDKRRKTREQYADEIARKRFELTKELMRMQKTPGMEYGAMIYELNGKIYSTPITEGHWDFQGWNYPFFSDKKLEYRSTERDGKYYEYDLDSGEIDWAHPMSSEYERYTYYSKSVPEDKIGWSTKHFTNKSASWTIDTETNIPSGATVVEYTHIHPGENSFSYRDLYIAEEFGINATVVNRGSGSIDNADFRETTFDPDTQSFSSKTNPFDDLKSKHKDVMKEKNKHYSYRCVKCGATR